VITNANGEKEVKYEMGAWQEKRRKMEDKKGKMERLIKQSH